MIDTEQSLTSSLVKYPGGRCGKHPGGDAPGFLRAGQAPSGPMPGISLTCTLMRKPTETPRRRARGFTAAADLMRDHIRAGGEARGFAVTRLLTCWEEVAGATIAAFCRPVEISYRKSGLGATLTVLTTGAVAPLVEMRKIEIIERVNACYGYNAVSRLRITQTAPRGFAEPATPFTHRHSAPPTPDAEAEAATAGVADTELRLALATLAANVRAKTKP